MERGIRETRIASVIWSQVLRTGEAYVGGSCCPVVRRIGLENGWRSVCHKMQSIWDILNYLNCSSSVVFIKGISCIPITIITYKINSTWLCIKNILKSYCHWKLNIPWKVLEKHINKIFNEHGLCVSLMLGTMAN